MQGGHILGTLVRDVKKHLMLLQRSGPTPMSSRKLAGVWRFLAAQSLGRWPGVAGK